MTQTHSLKALSVSRAVTGSVTLVGAGPGDPELLTLKAVKAIGQASVLLVDDLADSGHTLNAVIDLLKNNYFTVFLNRMKLFYIQKIVPIPIDDFRD